MAEKFDLTSFREKCLKMTQSQLANLMGIRQDRISRLEQNLENITPSELIKLANVSGKRIEEILNFENKPLKTLEINDTWKDIRYYKKLINNYFDSNLKKFNEKLKDKVPYSEDFFLAKNDLNEIKKWRNDLNEILRKPKIIFSGKSNSGKTTMINSLLGIDKLPTKWTPTTSIIIYIKDILDKPDFIDNELWIFKRNGEEEWNDSKLYDEDYCKEWKIASGNIELLKEYGVRKGNKFGEEVGSAVLFLDSPILKNCDLIDIPGLVGNIQRDNDTATKISAKADVLVYLMQSTSFLQNEDLTFLKNTLEILNPPKNSTTPFSNIFVVASHAHHLGNLDNVKDVLEEGFERFEGILTDRFWNKYSIDNIKVLSDDLRKRFFSYTIDYNYEEVRIDFETELKKVVEDLPISIKNSLIKLTTEYTLEKNDFYSKEILKTKKIHEQKEEFKRQYEILMKEEPLNKIKEAEIYSEVIKIIEKLKKESIENFNKEYSNIFTESNIVSIIEKRDYKKNQDDINALGNYVMALAQDGFVKVLEEETYEFKKVIDKYIEDIGEVYQSKDLKSPNINIEFNYMNAFLAGLTGLTTLGGLSAWAASLGNLGGYILVAKGVSLLSALGISIGGGTATAISFVSAIGGPIVLGISLSIAAIFAMWSILSSSWKNKIAEEMIEKFNKDIKPIFIAEIEKYWKETQIAFDKGHTSIGVRRTEYLNSMYAISQYNTEDFKKLLNKLEEIKDFIEYIPKYN